MNLGRKDFQVKVRGYRIEAAEIEMALLNLAGIKEAAVMAQQGARGDQRLVGYIIPNRLPAPSPGVLRQALTQVLPDYMVPSVFLVLEEFPRAPNGKLDRRALPQVSRSRPRMEIPYVRASTPVEEELVIIWSEVLDLDPDQVGVLDEFLDLGGDSLLAGQVVSRVLKAFQVEVPLRTLYEAPTISAIASAVVQTAVQQRAQTEVEGMLAEIDPNANDRL